MFAEDPFNVFRNRERGFGPTARCPPPPPRSPQREGRPHAGVSGTLREDGGVEGTLSMMLISRILALAATAALACAFGQLQWFPLVAMTMHRCEN